MEEKFSALPNKCTFKVSSSHSTSGFYVTQSISPYRIVIFKKLYVLSYSDEDLSFIKSSFLCKIEKSTLKIIVFLCASNRIAKQEIGKIVPFIMASKT